MSENKQTVETVETVETVDTTGAIKSASEQTEALIAAAREAHAAYLASGDTFVVSAARATFAAHTDGVIGKGQRFENSEQFGNLFPSRDGKGASKSTVTRWRRLGLALSLGINPDDAEFGYLSSKANDMGAALDKCTSKTAVRKVIADHKRKVAEKSAPAPAPAEDSDGEKGAQTTGAEKVTVPASVSGMLDLLETIAANLAGTSVSPAEAVRLAEVLDTLTAVKVADAETVRENRAA